MRGTSQASPCGGEQQVQRAGGAQPVPGLDRLVRAPRVQPGGAERARAGRGRSRRARRRRGASSSRAARPAPTCLTRSRYAVSAASPAGASGSARRDLDLHPEAPVVLPDARRSRTRSRSSRCAIVPTSTISSPSRSASTTAKPDSSLAQRRRRMTTSPSKGCRACPRHGRPPMLPACPAGEGLPEEVAPRRLVRRALQVVALLVVLVLIAVLAPGLGEVRDRLAEARRRAGSRSRSCSSCCRACPTCSCSGRSSARRCRGGRAGRSRGPSSRVGSIVPASGAGGLALGAWILHRGGMPADRIARRSVAFFLIKSSVNFVAVAVIGALMAVGLVGPHRSLLLTALPAALSVAVIALVLPSRGSARARPAPRTPPKLRRGGRRGAPRAHRRHGGGGRDRALARRARARRRDRLLGVGQRRPVGDLPRGRRRVPLTIVLMGYLIGQLGGLLPLPGGVGGIDGGLIGTLIVYGAPAGGDGGRRARLPRDPVLAPAARRRGGVRLAAQGARRGPAPRPLPPAPALVTTATVAGAADIPLQWNFKFSKRSAPSSRPCWPRGSTHTRWAMGAASATTRSTGRSARRSQT